MSKTPNALPVSTLPIYLTYEPPTPSNAGNHPKFNPEVTQKLSDTILLISSINVALYTPSSLNSVS
jgi:hypothetical protein